VINGIGLQNKMAKANLCDSIVHGEMIDFVAYTIRTDDRFLKMFSSQGLSNTVWGIATLISNQQPDLSENNSTSQDFSIGIQQSALAVIHFMAREIIARQASGFNSQDLSNTAWAFATVMSCLNSIKDGNLNKVVAIHSNEHARSLELMQVATHIVVQRSLEILPQFNGQGVCNLVWALGYLFDSKTDTIDQLLRSVKERCSDKSFLVEPRAISQTLWGIAKLKFVDDSLYLSIASRLQSTNASTFQAQTISNIVWALATAGVKVNYKEIQRIATSTQLITKHSQISTKDPVLQFCAIAAQEFINRPHEFNSQNIANMCWSFAVLGVKHLQFLFSVDREIKNRINKIRNGEQDEISVFNGQEIANVLW
jgi:Protein of unknown function (DUF1601)